jgi:hypothetical protein
MVEYKLILRGEGLPDLEVQVKNAQRFPGAGEPIPLEVTESFSRSGTYRVSSITSLSVRVKRADGTSYMEEGERLLQNAQTLKFHQRQLLCGKRFISREELDFRTLIGTRDRKD